MSTPVADFPYATSTDHLTHDRAAILTFGGWGLQVLFHLLPRLAFHQEQRMAQGLTGGDLTRLVQFGALMPDPLLHANQARFQLYRPRLDRSVSPFAVERILRAQPVAGRAAATPLTDSEGQAARLLDALQPALLPLGPESGFAHPFAPMADVNAAPTPTHLSRQQIFRAGLVHAQSVAQQIQTHIIDPVRQESLAPSDPFVQTTLYVVAPLFEPLASALLWPVLAQLMANLGRRHLFQVVGFLATGSYAQDQSRGLEDGAAYVALRELEALTGLGAERELQGRLAHFLDQSLGLNQDAGWSHLRRQMGERIFDQIYLLDREKSNQGLAENSQELAVLAGNALDVLVAGGGSRFVQDQLGASARILEDRPYSVLGAASDYVPLDAILTAASQQEEKRLARDVVLADQVAAPMSLDQASMPFPTLAHLGIAPSHFLAQLVVRHPDLFGSETPQTVADLTVHPDFVLPPSVAAELRTHRPLQWEAVYGVHRQEVQAHFDLVADVRAAWGLDGLDERGRLTVDPEQAEAYLLPGVMVQIQEVLLDVLGGTPGGLSVARLQVQNWLEQVDGERQELRRQVAPGMRRLQQAQRLLAVREWRRRYQPRAAIHPPLWRVWLRSTLAVICVVLAALGYMFLSQQAFDPQVDGLLLVGFGTGAYVAGAFAWAGYIRRLEQLRLERVALSQAELTAELQERARKGLIQVYTHLMARLQELALILDQTTAEIRQWSHSDEMPNVISAGARDAYLRMPQVNQELWERCRAYLRSREDGAGQGGEARLRQLWGSIQWRQEMRRLLSGQSQPREGEAETVAELLKRTIGQAVAPVTVQRANPARSQLIRDLGQSFHVEHLLWRKPTHSDQARYHPGEGWSVGDSVSAQAGARRAYLESVWNRARPSTNFDIADRVAVTGIQVDVAAVSGHPDSDLTEAALRDFRLTRLPTQDPFSITVLRTVHGLGLGDLSCVAQYQRIYQRLPAQEQARLVLVTFPPEPVQAKTHSTQKRTTGGMVFTQREEGVRVGED